MNIRLRMDWRRWTIAITVIVMIAVTIAIYMLAHDEITVPLLNAFFKPWIAPEKEIGAVFAAWTGGLVLFVIAGAFIAIVSLDRPEDAYFDTRARILFRKQPGKHIDYAVAKIPQMLEHYAESTTVKVAIRAFDKDSGKYRLHRDSNTCVRSYIDDVAAIYVARLQLAEVTLPPAGKDRNRLVYVRVNGEPVGDTEEFDREFLRSLSCTIEPGRTCEVHSLLETWQEMTTEPYIHTPVRFTQAISVSFDNQLSEDIVIEYKIGDTMDPIPERLAAKKSRQIINLVDRMPGQVAFEYVIRPA